MKIKYIFLGLIAVALSAPASAQIIWSADPDKSQAVADHFKRFDDGNYPQDYCAKKGDEKGVSPSTVTVTSDEALGNVWMINKPVNRKRGEFARFEGRVNSYTPAEGDDIYIAWQWKIDTGNGAKIDKEITVFQWKSAAPHDQNYPLNFEYDGHLTLNAFGPDYEGKTSYGSRRTVLWRQALPQGQWVSFVVRINVSKDDFGGLVQFWFNGELQALDNLKSKTYQVKLSDDKMTAYHRTNDGRFVYPKWGAYNKRSCLYEVNTYFHDMKVGRSLESVMPTN